MVIENRIHLAKYFNKLGFKKGAEIGVSEGYNAENLCKNIPDLELYCVDIWESKTRYNKAKQRLAPYNAKLIREPSIKALNRFKDGELDFVFIDADHRFDGIMVDIIEWSKKVKPYGIVSGHDYYHFRESGVMEAVNAYTSAHRINFMLTGTDQNSKDDKVPSFYWKKP